MHFMQVIFLHSNIIQQLCMLLNQLLHLPSLVSVPIPLAFDIFLYPLLIFFIPILDLPISQFDRNGLGEKLIGHVVDVVEYHT